MEVDYKYTVVYMGKPLFHTNIHEIAQGAIEDLGGTSLIQYNEEAIIQYMTGEAA